MTEFSKELEKLDSLLQNTEKSATQLYYDIKGYILEFFQKNNNNLDYISELKTIIVYLQTKRSDLIIFKNIGDKLSEIVLLKPKIKIKSCLDNFLMFTKGIEIDLNNSVINAVKCITKSYQYNKILVISYSKLVLDVLIKLEPDTIYVCESRPLLEGNKFALDLRSRIQKKSSINIICDALSSSYIKEVDLVLIGMDSWFKDNAITNKIGSLGLAISAKYFNKPFIVIGSTLKKTLLDSVEFKPEFYDINHAYPSEFQQQNITIINQYFEVIPQELITEIIR